jgi:alkylhydroperoxidase family enzyme
MTKTGGHAQRPNPADVEAREELILGQPQRIKPLTDMSDEMRAMVAPPRGYGSEIPEMFAILLRNPELLRVFRPMGSHFIVDGLLPPRDRELAILRTGWLCQSPFEWAEHVAIGKQVGLATEEIERVTEGPVALGWNDYDRALLRAVDELMTDAMISDATWEILATKLEDEQLIEIPLLVGTYQGIAYLVNSLRMRLREGYRGLSAR